MEPTEPMALTKRQKIVRKLRSNKRLARVLAVCSVITLAIVGTILLRLTFANTTTTSTNTDCGRKVNPYNYEVPFRGAIWNQPICGLPRHPRSADYASRFLNWSHVNDGSPAADVNNGKIRNNPGFPKPTFFDPDGLVDLYSREIYYASEADKTRKVVSASYYSNLDGINLPYQDRRLTFPDNPIPWNDKWKAGITKDGEMMILDDRVGTEGYGRMYKLSSFNNVITPDGRVYAGSVDVARDLNGNYASYVDYTGFIKDRGVGLSFLATLTLPEEVAAGEIRHALGIAIPNTAYGPICDNSQLGFLTGNWNQENLEGKTCGTAIAPATKFENKDRRSSETIPEPTRSLYTIDKTIPEGMLFALDITYEQIDAWIQSRPDLVSNPRKAETARIFARAMKDYGMMIADTNGGSPSIQTAGGINEDNRQKWIELGMGPNDTSFTNNMFNGLINESNLYVVKPPVANCTNGTKSRYYCDWTSVAYEGVSGDTEKPITTISSPGAGATVSNITTINGSASDNVGVDEVKIKINGNIVYSVKANSSYTYSWDTRPLTNGSYTITIEASDVAGNIGTATRTVTVSNSQPPPPKTADFNKSGKVDPNDLAILLGNYKKSVTPGTNGDASGDGKVELIDLSMLLAQYG
jgi:hypothetical protein